MGAARVSSPLSPGEASGTEWPGPTPAATPPGRGQVGMRIQRAGTQVRVRKQCRPRWPFLRAHPSWHRRASLSVPQLSLAILVIPHRWSQLSLGFLSGPTMQKALQVFLEVGATGSRESGVRGHVLGCGSCPWSFSILWGSDPFPCTSAAEPCLPVMWHPCPSVGEGLPLGGRGRPEKAVYCVSGTR